MLFLAVLAGFLTPQETLACSATVASDPRIPTRTPPSLQDQVTATATIRTLRFREADAVFIGVVIQTHEEWWQGQWVQRATLLVQRVWKGDFQPRVEVISPGIGGGCGLEFNTNLDYLVIASLKGNDLVTTSGATNRASFVTDDIKALGPAVVTRTVYPPTVSAPTLQKATTTSASSGSVAVVFMFFGLLIALIAGVFALRARS